MELFPFILTILENKQGGYYCPHFTKEEVNSEREKVTCLRFQSETESEPEPDPEIETRPWATYLGMHGK